MAATGVTASTGNRGSAVSELEGQVRLELMSESGGNEVSTATAPTSAYLGDLVGYWIVLG